MISLLSPLLGWVVPHWAGPRRLEPFGGPEARLGHAPRPGRGPIEAPRPTPRSDHRRGRHGRDRRSSQGASRHSTQGANMASSVVWFSATWKTWSH